jgi:hypothetical protein
VSDLPHQERRPIAVTAKDDEQGRGVTRRTILAGAAAATAAATLAVVDTPANARRLDPNSSEDMALFVLLSAALTGIYEAKLAPELNTRTFRPPDQLRLFLKQLKPSDLPELVADADPVGIKRDYFKLVNDRSPAAFETLLRITKESINTPDREQAIISKIPAADDTELTQSEIDIKYLARSIVLMWYLGAWSDPDDLQTSNASNSKVISAKAYTQGWALKVAQAHPMGFSEMQFGYWTRPPNPRVDFTG